MSALALNIAAARADLRRYAKIKHVGVLENEVAKMRAVLGEPTPTDRPMRAEPPPGLTGSARAKFMARAWRRHKVELYHWLMKERAVLEEFI